MTATEKLLTFVRAVKAARDLRRVPENERPKNWPEQMREANRAVDELLAVHLGEDEQPALPPIPVPGEGSGELPPVPMPEVPPLPPAEQPAARPRAAKRGGQHGD
jgi:hypothetical protein